MALSSLGEPGLLLWDNWSRQSDKWQPGVCSKKWQGFRSGDPADRYTLSWKSIIRWARQDNPGMARMPLAPEEGIRPSHYIQAAEAAGWQFRMNETTWDVEINGLSLSSPIWDVLMTNFREHGYKNETVARQAVTTVAMQPGNRYHPVRDYLNGLTWDGEDHMGKLASYFTDKHGMFPRWFRYWMIGAVARAFEKHGTQNRTLILDGAQNLGKSFFVRWLASPLPALYVDSAIDPSNKDYHIRAMGNWIWEVAELGATVRRSDREALKSFLTMERTTVRKPYARQDMQGVVLMASFIGTINNEAGFLEDPTGLRRFMVCTLESINWSYSKDVDINQLWGQAKALYDAGEPWKLTSEDYVLSEKISAEYETEDVLENSPPDVLRNRPQSDGLVHSDC